MPKLRCIAVAKACAVPKRHEPSEFFRSVTPPSSSLKKGFPIEAFTALHPGGSETSQACCTGPSARRLRSARPGRGRWRRPWLAGPTRRRCGTSNPTPRWPWCQLHQPRNCAAQRPLPEPPLVALCRLAPALAPGALQVAGAHGGCDDAVVCLGPLAWKFGLALRNPTGGTLVTCWPLRQASTQNAPCSPHRNMPQMNHRILGCPLAPD